MVYVKITLCVRRLCYLCSHCTQGANFGQAFLKACAGQGREALGALRRERNSPIVRKTQERVNLFATQIKRENPRRGFSLVLSFSLKIIKFYIFPPRRVILSRENFTVYYFLSLSVSFADSSPKGRALKCIILRHSGEN